MTVAATDDPVLLPLVGVTRTVQISPSCTRFISVSVSEVAKVGPWATRSPWSLVQKSIFFEFLLRKTMSSDIAARNRIKGYFKNRVPLEDRP